MDTGNPLDHIPRDVLVQAAVALANGALRAPLPAVEVTLAKLRIRAEIRRRIRAEGDRIAEVCDEAVAQIEALQRELAEEKVRGDATARQLHGFIVGCGDDQVQIAFLKDHLLAWADKYNTVNQRLKQWQDRATVAESRVFELERQHG